MLQFDEEADLLHREEKIHRDLIPHIVTETRLGPMLKHPLVYELFVNVDRAAFINKRYAYKLRAVTEAEHNGEWMRAIFLHERPYRVNALMRYASEMEPEAYWKCLAHVWVDSENLDERSVAAQELLFLRYPEPRTGLMTPEELETVAALPDEVTVYRGQVGELQTDLSWSLDQKVAKWFARRWDAPGQVLVGKIQKKDIWAVFLSRDEREVVAAQKSVTIVG